MLWDKKQVRWMGCLIIKKGYSSHGGIHADVWLEITLFSWLFLLAKKSIRKNGIECGHFAAVKGHNAEGGFVSPGRGARFMFRPSRPIFGMCWLSRRSRPTFCENVFVQPRIDMFRLSRQKMGMFRLSRLIDHHNIFFMFFFGSQNSNGFVQGWSQNKVTSAWES